MARGFFGKLLGTSSDHPLASARGVKKAINALDRSTPLALLRDVNHYLGLLESLFKESDGHEAIEALYALEVAARPFAATLFHEFITEGNPRYLSEQVRATLDLHALELFELHVQCVRLVVSASPQDLRYAHISALRAFRAWSLATRLRRVYYRNLTEILWDLGNKFHVQLLQKCPAVLRANVADVGQTSSSPLNEYVKTLYTEVLPSSNLSPAQIVFMEHVVGLNDSLTFTPVRNATSTHRLDLKSSVGLSKINGNHAVTDAENEIVRFISTIDAARHIENLSRTLTDTNQQPPWIQAYPLDENLKESALRITAKHWLNTTLPRTAPRSDHGDDIMVVLGSRNAQAMIGISEEVQLLAQAATQQSGETSFEILYRLEATVAGASIETWRQVDQSDTGFAARVPALMPKYRVNVPIAFRYSEGILWRPGVIRRIGRDSNNQPTLGIELINRAPEKRAL